MMFSIAGYCVKTRMLGAAAAASDIAVGAVSLFGRAHAGIAVIQNYADPSLGSAALEVLKTDKSADATLEYLVEVAHGISWRQILIVDHKGDTAHYSGIRNKSPYRAAKGGHCVAAGVQLSDPGVPQACVTAFEMSYDSGLADRLMFGLEAGLRASGEKTPLRSAALLILHREEWPLVDLRVDNHAAPVFELRKAWTAFEPVAMDYVNRAVDPDTAPEL